MDLLCSESLHTDTENLLHSHKYQNDIRHSNSSSSSNESTTLSSCSSSLSASSTLSCIRSQSNDSTDEDPTSVCNSVNELVCVFTSVATSGGTVASSPLSSPQSQSISYRRSDQSSSIQPPAAHLPPTSTRIRNLSGGNPATTTTVTADSQIYLNKVAQDSIFKTERCLENALKLEEKLPQILATYFVTVQKDITPPMRKIVVEWMMEVCNEEKCQEEVVLLALNYMDRFLSSKSVRKTHLQILGAACLLLASKLREPNCLALSAELLVFYTDNSINKDDLIKWELFVLSRLGWNLSSVTALDFLELLMIRLQVQYKNFSDLNIEKVRQHALIFISLAAKEHKFAKYTASTIAASSIAASISGLKWHLSTGHNIHFFLSFLTDLTSVGQDQLQQCMMQMEAIFEEHSRQLQPYFAGVDNPQQAHGYYSSAQHKYHQQPQQQQYQYQKSLVPVLPKFSQTCKMQAQTTKELHEIKF